MTNIQADIMLICSDEDRNKSIAQRRQIYEYFFPLKIIINNYILKFSL